MSGASGGVTWHTIQRSLLPDHDAAARMPLYARGGEPLSRTSVRVRPGARVTFATYFGALPAAYWRAHTVVRRVRLSLSLEGAATVQLWRTDGEGAVSLVEERRAAEADCTIELILDGSEGWLWCEAVAGEAGSVIDDIRWESAGERGSTSTLTVAITTYNREAECLRLLGRLAADPDVLERVGSVVVADQGSRPLADAQGFGAAAAGLGGRLRVFTQANLGGSGGFSRGMMEAAASASSHVLLLDDDVDLEPESLLRLAAFAEHSTTPLIVGAQMLSLVEPTTLHSFGERVERGAMWWTPVEPTLSPADLATTTIENTPALSRRIDVDFNGWWMCLLPVSLVRREGASLPYFIKWDDAEYGLRAASRGVRTVTLPGAALWHMPWTAKDDGVDWQAYFQLRNRLVTALLHGGRGVLAGSFAQDLNHVLCAQYGSAALRNLALKDVLAGPRHLDPVTMAGPTRPREVLARFGQLVQADAGATATGALRTRLAPPAGRAASIGRLARVLAHQLRRPRADAVPVRLARAEGKWWALGVRDSAVVDAASGAGVFVMRRDRGTAFRQLSLAITLRARLWSKWSRVARDYRESAAELASPAAWERRFHAASEGP